jgi:hypothetical protein
METTGCSRGMLRIAAQAEVPRARPAAGPSSPPRAAIAKAVSDHVRIVEGEIVSALRSVHSGELLGRPCRATTVSAPLRSNSALRASFEMDHSPHGNAFGKEFIDHCASGPAGLACHRNLWLFDKASPH